MEEFGDAFGWHLVEEWALVYDESGKDLVFENWHQMGQRSEERRVGKECRN